MADPLDVDVLLFDMFGTVVDWRGSIIAAGRALGIEHGIEVDWPAFADRWRTEGYLDPISRMVSGEEGYRPIEEVLRSQLDRLAEEYGLFRLGGHGLQRLSSVWQRLDPWSDSTAGLQRLRSRYVTGPLSNGSFASLTRMSRHGGLSWDCIIAAELFGTYKPDPRTYEGACRLLDSPPDRVMLVAAHPTDLAAARRCGLRTGFIPRPLEWGPGGRPSSSFDADIQADSLESLASALEAGSGDSPG